MIRRDGRSKGSRGARYGLLMLSLMASAGCVKTPPVVPRKEDPEVRVSGPVKETVTDYEYFTGRTEALNTIEVTARVTGYLERFLFDEGKEVEEGEVLFKIDDRPYKAAYDRARAEVEQTKARVLRTEADYQRVVSTFDRGASSRSEYDLAAAAYAEARAAVGVAEASLELARLNLDWTEVKAPIRGRISRRMVDPGNLVRADTTPLTTIVAVDKVYANFDVDERTVLLLQRMDPTQQERGGYEEGVWVDVELADEQGYPHRGRINFSDNRIDPSTGTLRVRAVIDNPPIRTSSTRDIQRVMAPGLFVRVRLPIGSPHEALMVPEQAIGKDQERKFVYVVNAEDQARYQPVKVGSLRGDLRVIEEGLKEGDRVVVSGLQRIRDGIKVVPRSAEDRATPTQETAQAEPVEAPTASPTGGG